MNDSQIITRRVGYGVALFLSSAGALVIEIVAGRMLAPYIGMSLYTWTAIIATVLAGLSVGHWIGGELSNGTHTRTRRVLAAAMWLAASSAAGSLLLIRLLSPAILGAGLDPIVAIILLAASLFFLPSLFVGVVSPALTKLAVDDAPHSAGRVIGQMYAVSAIGSIVGTLGAGYVFISWIGSIGTMLVVAAVFASLGAILALSARLSRLSLSALSIITVATVVAGVTAGQRVAAFVSPCTEESNYYCIRVIDYTFDSGRPSALMVLDHMGHGINDRDDPTRLHTSYVELVDELLRARGGSAEAFSAFFIGGGAYTLPRAWSAAFPRAALTVAEVDPAVTRVAREHMWLDAAPNLTIEHEDARMLLQSMPSQRQFDVIVGDAFHDISVPAHLVTREFASEVHGRLALHGFYALTVIDHSRKPLFLFSSVRTLLEVFPKVEVWVDSRQMAAGGRLTFLVLAANESTTASRITSRPTAEPEAQRVWLRWPPRRLMRAIEASATPVLTDDYAPVDRLMFPVLKEDL